MSEEKTRARAIEILENRKAHYYGLMPEWVWDMAIEALKQEPKTGHWIRMKAYEKWECSDCNTVFRFTFKEHNFCPNCGAKMVEPQESEDKE